MSDIITTLHPENDANTNLYPNIKKVNIPDKAIDLTKLDGDVIDLLNQINQPNLNFDTTEHIEGFTTDKGVYVSTTTGYIYVWNETGYDNTNLLYMANNSESVYHDGNQLTDNNGNNIYPNIDNNIIRNIDFNDTAIKYDLSKSVTPTWEMGMYDHNNSYNSTTRCRTVNALDIQSGKNIIHLLDNSVRFYIYEYLNGTYVDTVGGGWKTSDFEFFAKVGYTYKVVASFNPERTISDINEVVSKIIIYTQINYDLIIKNPKDALLKGMCHRGYRLLAPENSIYAFKLAKLYGFSYIETDVQFTSDNVPVMFHDDYINDKSDYVGSNTRISELTYAQLLELDFGSWFSSEYAGLKILSFDDYLSTMKQLDLIGFVELKTPSNLTTAQAQILYNLTKKHNMLYKTYWLGYDILGLVRLRDIDNDLMFAPAVPINNINVEDLLTFDITFPNPHDLVIFTDINNMNDTTNQAFVDANKKCGVWAVNNDSTNANVIKASKYCCEYVQTDGINVLELFLK